VKLAASVTERATYLDSVAMVVDRTARSSSWSPTVLFKTPSD